MSIHRYRQSDVVGFAVGVSRIGVHTGMTCQRGDGCSSVDDIVADEFLGRFQSRE